MSLITHDYYCPKIGMASEFRLVMPDSVLRGEEKPKGLLFLLPREGESGLSLLTKTSLSALTEEYRIAAVIPPCLQGCFTDMVYGYPFYQSLKYLREYLAQYFPGLRGETGKCAVLGFGISGAASLHWATEEPDYFAASGAVSGLLDPAMEPWGRFTENRLRDLFGTREERTGKRDAFLSACAASAVKKVLLFSSENEPGYASVLRAFEAFSGRAELRPLTGKTEAARDSTALGEFIRDWIGGEN